MTVPRGANDLSVAVTEAMAAADDHDEADDFPEDAAAVVVDHGAVVGTGRSDILVSHQRVEIFVRELQ